jgi:iron complex transport system permease protein
MSLLSIGAFLGGMLAVYLVYSLAKNPFGTSVATMLLAGIGITALVGSVTGFLEFYADNEMLRRISLWRMGGLEAATFDHVLLAGSVAILMFIVLPRYSYALNALLLGESEARHLGIDTEQLKKISILFVAAGVGICVALAGVIGFVGLVVPHIFRLLIGPDHRYLLPASALGGAILLVLSDNLSRVILAPVELPVGIITAFIGVPFFISLLTRRHSIGIS